jgi:hypothetical protein
MDDDKFEPLDNWLSKNGVGLELHVAGAFKKKFSSDHYWTDIQHSYQYLDSKKEDGELVLRETDVVITKSKRLYNNLLITVRLVIECKHGAGIPIVLYKESSQLPKFNFDPLEDLWECKKTESINTKNISGVAENALFAGQVKKTCYSINTIYPEGKSNPKINVQNSIRQLASGLEGVLDQTVNDPMASNSVQILIPILMTKSPIFTLELANDGQIIKNHSIRELLIWRTKASGEGSQGFWVMHYDALDGLIEDFDKFFNELDYRQS